MNKQESKTHLQNCFKQWEGELYVDKTIGQLKKGKTQDLKNWADESRTGPASSRCNQCDFIGPRVSGDPALRSNSVETVYKIRLLANSALVRTNIDTKDGRLCPQTQTFYSSPKTLTVNTKRKFFVLTNFIFQLNVKTILAPWWKKLAGTEDMHLFHFISIGATLHSKPEKWRISGLCVFLKVASAFATQRESPWITKM